MSSLSQGNITRDFLLSIFEYDRESGRLFNKKERRYAIPGKEAGTLASNGYLTTMIEGKIYYVHRLIWIIEHGEWPEGQIDHIDGVKTNNKITNLRDVDYQENRRNLPIQHNNKSGLPGVYKCTRSGVWVAQIKVCGRQVYLGRSWDFFEACCIRKSAENSFGFHENHGRVPNER